MLPLHRHKEVARLLDQSNARQIIEGYVKVFGRYPSYIEGLTDSEYLDEVKRRTEKALNS